MVLCMRVTLLESALKAEKGCIARLDEDHVHETARNPDVFAVRQMADDALKNQLRNLEETPRQVRGKLTFAIKDLKHLCLQTKIIEEKLLIDRTDS